MKHFSSTHPVLIQTQSKLNVIMYGAVVWLGNEMRSVEITLGPDRHAVFGEQIFVSCCFAFFGPII